MTLLTTGTETPALQIHYYEIILSFVTLTPGPIFSFGKKSKSLQNITSSKKIECFRNFYQN